MTIMWDTIIKDITKDIDVIYIAIGCALDRYSELTQSNNQQCPCFLDKFKRKLIVLVDPYLETPLMIQNEIKNLNQIQDGVHRILKNDSLIIHAIEKYFYYNGICYDGYTNSKIEMSEIEYKYNSKYLLKIIELVLSLKIKFIFQDYTGDDTTMFYCNLIKIFESDPLNPYKSKELLKYVTFDITQKDCGCFVDICPDIIKYDRDDNFIQEKFLPLKKINKLNTFRNILKYRIDLLNYQLLWTYNKLIDKNEWNPSDIYYEVILLCTIYNYDSLIETIDNNNFLHVIDQIRELIIIIIKDIVDSLNCEKEMINYLANNLTSRSEFINITSMLKDFN